MSVCEMLLFCVFGRSILLYMMSKVKVNRLEMLNTRKLQALCLGILLLVHISYKFVYIRIKIEH
jgi:hypothetical protein